jgi:DNA-binding beta-propeller fold protein YncE
MPTEDARSCCHLEKGGDKVFSREIETGGFMMYGRITRVLLTATAVASLGLAGTATPASAAPMATKGPVTVYVANIQDETVTPILAATNKAGTPIPVVGYPGVIAITPDGQTAYVAGNGFYSEEPGTVTPISTATNTAGTPITVGVDPDVIAITPNGKTVYVTNFGYSSGQTVTPIHTATNSAARPITVGNGPDAIAITP